jgi:hypothetical protein
MNSSAEQHPLPSGRASSAWNDVAESLKQALAREAPEAQLRALVREWSEEARRRQLGPEQFLVALKSELLRVPALQHRNERTRRNEQFERIVSMCIEEYYTTPPEGASVVTQASHASSDPTR